VWALVAYFLANFILSLDLLDLLLRIRILRRLGRRSDGRSCPTSVPLDVGSFTAHQVRLHLDPFALLVSIHNLEATLDDFLEAMGPLRDRLWVIDDASTDDSFFRLQRGGVPCFRTERNRKKPGALRELLQHLPDEVTTVMVLDPDVRILNGGRFVSDLERVIFDFQRSGRAAMCPHVVVRPDGWLARIQALEYSIALSIGRKSLGDHSITSGVSLYRRDALEKALEKHTLSVYAEDLRNTLILLGEGETVYYDQRLSVETEGKRTWHAWFAQRVGWHYGLLKVYWENFDDVKRAARGRPFRAYQFLVYTGIFVLAFHPLRVAALAVVAGSTLNGFDQLLGISLVPNTAFTEPTLFLFAYIKYTAFAFVASFVAARDRREWARFLPAVPVYFFYVMAHVVPVTIGYLNWFALRLFGRRLYRDHYEDEESWWRAERRGGRP
jgi:cellulose synthase/poly-beta-1,6-N-acetylglucosamine synthase-like glycosyltransferase